MTPLDKATQRWLAWMFADQIPGLDDKDKGELVDYLVDGLEEGPSSTS